MGLISFFKDAGEKLFGHKEAEQVAARAQAGEAAAQSKLEELNSQAADAIVAYVHAQGLDAESLAVAFDGANSTVSVFGTAPDQATREKIVLCCGNVAGVAKVEDGMSTGESEPEATYYEVVRGDTLSKIAKQQYGDANKYPVIFEANKPMLTHPDKIYPGQVLRIPPI
jgi:nucleoid-associated protein YgaU